MLNLMRAVDRATGYVFIPTSDSKIPEGVVQDSNVPASQRPNSYALFSTAAGPLMGTRSDVRDVQERWIDSRKEWDAFEKLQWRREGEFVRKEAVPAARRTQVCESKGPEGSSQDEIL